NLRLAAIDPEPELLLAQRAFVDEADRLVAEAGRQRANAQVPPPLRAMRGDHRLVGADQLIEIIEDDAALDQRLAAVEHQGRYPSQRIIGRDQIGIAEGRPRLVLEGDAVQPHRDGDAAHEGRVVLADQKHLTPSPRWRASRLISPPRCAGTWSTA